MSSAAADLKSNLQAMLILKPPGVSRSKINTLTNFCITNVQYESLLLGTIYAHFKNAPGSHKLGVLYVVDSVIRKWSEQASRQGQPVGGSAAEGSFAAGVNRATDLMPELMNDVIFFAPQNQREKIRKLIHIWEKGETFLGKMIEAFKDKLNNSQPANTLLSLGNRSDLAPPAVPANMENLADIARQNANKTQKTPASSDMALTTLSAPDATLRPSSNPAAPASFTLRGMPFLPTSQAAPLTVTPPAPPFKAPQPQPAQLSNFRAQNGVAGAMNVIPAAAPGQRAGTTDPIALQVALIQHLIEDGLSPEYIASVIKAFLSNTAVAAPQISSTSENAYLLPPNGTGDSDPSRSDDTCASRSPTNGTHGRSRQRFSARPWEHRDASPGRDERRFRNYEPNPPPRDRYNDRARNRQYRQRSPHRRYGHSRRTDGIATQQHKWIAHDPNLSSGCIKVLSRTLFVGGVNCSEDVLRNIFNGFGAVQTCIVKKVKRHAFVKMCRRQDAVIAKEAMKSGRSPDVQQGTRWGVGFGPRNCSNYRTGISIIPIHRLTEADCKCMLTAGYGGSGGQPITQGMVVEEPDVEINNGLSSKAISKRMHHLDKPRPFHPESSDSTLGSIRPAQSSGPDRLDKDAEVPRLEAKLNSPSLSSTTSGSRHCSDDNTLPFSIIPSPSLCLDEQTLGVTFRTSLSSSPAAAEEAKSATLVRRRQPYPLAVDFFGDT
ncbi:hypothetical protein F5883DRAFT_570271 [Diaporthe sp. PMI_573]|nr:hypothetical protein F5883DRAFT_570271 [Diaporthaceae sp. PMI_573]